MKLFRIIPPAISGLALGVASLGVLLETLLSQIFPGLALLIKTACGIIAGIGIILLTLRAIFDFKNLHKEFENNVIAWSVLPTYFMSCMVLSTYLKPIIGEAAFYLWATALSIQLALVVYFIFRFVLKFKITNVYSSWFVIAAGFVVGTTTSPAFEMYGVGKILLILGVIGYALGVPLVAYRLIKHPIQVAAAKPTVAISMAPANLLIAGYITLVNAQVLPLSFVFLCIMLTLSLAGIIFVVATCMPLLLKEFYPSFAAFTFPFVISATALTHLSRGPFPALSPIAFALQIAATLIVVWVLVRYIAFLSEQIKSS